MAFDRFVRRYASALSDSAFIDELGPIPAATNAVVFDHLLSRLLERQGVSPRWAIDAQIATWRFLWGNDDLSAVTEHLDDETGEAVRHVLSDAGARVTTLRGLIASLDYAVEDDTKIALRDTARHLLTDAGFGLDAALLSEAAGGTPCRRNSLAHSRKSQRRSPQERSWIMFSPRTASRDHRQSGVRRRFAGWAGARPLDTGRRPSSSEPRSTALRSNVHTRCSSGSQWRRTSHVATTYVRARFEGNGKAVAYWDQDTESGVVMVDDEIEDLHSFHAAWPDWRIRVDELESQARRP